MTPKPNTGSSRALALLLLSAVVAAGYLLWRVLGPGTETRDWDLEPGAAMESPVEPPETAQLANVGQEPPGTEAVPEAALSKVDSAGQTRKEVPREPPEPEAANEEIVGVAGTVVVLGGEPVAASMINGVMEVTVWGERSGTPIDVSVKNGAFELAFAPEGEDRLLSLQGNRTIQADTGGLQMDFSEPSFNELGTVLIAQEAGAAAPGESARVPFGTSDAVVYVVRAPLTRLRVVDKQTGTPLSGVQVVGIGNWEMEEARHPMGLGAEPLTEETQSPVTLHPPRSLATSTSINALVSADGYAWASVTLDLWSGGERTVELERGGTLRVSIDGQVPRSGRLRLYATPPGAPIHEMKVPAGKPVVYEDLAAGEYDVRLELGDWYQDPKRLCGQKVIVEANGDVSVDLAFAPVVAAPKAKASGVLVIPFGWDLGSFYAMTELLGASSDGSEQRHVIRQRDLTAVPGQPGSFSFAIPPREVGRYEFDLSPLGWKQIYDLPPEGRTDLRFQLPEPVEFTVRVLDAATGDPADVESVSWNPVWPKEAHGGSLMTENNPESPGLFRFHVTQGEVNVSCWELGYTGSSKTLDARNTSEVTLELTRSSSATLVLRDGDQTVPWPEAAEYDIEPVDGGDGHYNSSGSADGVRWFGVSKPGRYRIALPELNGFESQEPIEFEMLKGERIELIIELVRR